MKSTLDRGSVNQPIEKAPTSTSRTVPVSEEDSNKQVCKLLKILLYVYLFLNHFCFTNYFISGEAEGRHRVVQAERGPESN